MQCVSDNYKFVFVTGVATDVSATYWYAYGERYVYLIAYIAIISMMVLSENERNTVDQVVDLQQSYYRICEIKRVY